MNSSLRWKLYDRICFMASISALSESILSLYSYTWVFWSSTSCARANFSSVRLLSFSPTLFALFCTLSLSLVIFSSLELKRYTSLLLNSNSLLSSFLIRLRLLSSSSSRASCFDSSRFCY